MTSYAILLCLALALNTDDRRMLALTLLVGAGIFASVPDNHFYLFCMLGEILIALGAYWLNTRATPPIIGISALLLTFHSLGWLFNGYPTASPYHLMVQICEHAELAMCILLSTKITRKVPHDPRLR